MKPSFYLLNFIFWSEAAKLRLGILDYVFNILGRRATPERRRAAWRGLRSAMRGLYSAARRWLGALNAAR